MVHSCIVQESVFSFQACEPLVQSVPHDYKERPVSVIMREVRTLKLARSCLHLHVLDGSVYDANARTMCMV